MSAVKGTIKPTDEISEFFVKAHRIHTGSIMALQLKTNSKRGHQGRVAYIAGKKLGSAPKRNKMKRWMREAARQLKAPWDGFDVLFVAKKAPETTSFRNVLHDMTIIQDKLTKSTAGRKS